ncbi:RodZ domain-containing protein [uncultured Planococcus sp.]|uniref:helix-turn-helix domain-containing protein n=1 Tax=Planococcus donghaensis TaxID=414778 RepID=UPI0026029578|nr:RodZ domain-containing protein [uncultured Planococcus sp.]
MSELGARLKQARIAKGYSLEDLQDLTKIQKRYLAGIEDGNHSMMPGSFYVRAFIKQYAAAVGLNGEELLDQYKTEMPANEPAAQKQMPSALTSRSRSVSRTAPNEAYAEFIPKVLVALFIVLILAVAWYFYSASTNTDTASTPVEEEGGVPYEEPVTSVPEPREEETAEEPVEEPAEEPAEPEAVLSVEETQGETTTFSWQGPAERQLEIAASGPSWIAATDENQNELTSEARVMQAEETETIDLSEVETVRLRIGDYSNIALTLNGEPIEYTQQLQPQNIVIQFTDAE